MKKTKRRKKKLQFLRAGRDLSKLEFEIIEFVWRWKVVPSSLVQAFLMKSKTDWQAYKIIRKLKLDGILEEIPKGKIVNHRLLCVTELGFDIYLADRDHIDKFRFRVHAPAHDYLATALQLSCLPDLTDERFKVFSEQEIQTLPANALPLVFHDAVNFTYFQGTSFSHVPDGITSFGGKKNVCDIAYEVEINLKPDSRYQSMGSFYRNNGENKNKVSLVVILIRTEWVGRKIYTVFENQVTTEKLPPVCHVMIDDFIKNGPEAKIFAGTYIGESLRKAHENIWQDHGKAEANVRQYTDWSSFFPKRKSPVKSKTSLNTQDSALGLTPPPSLDGK